MESTPQMSYYLAGGHSAKRKSVLCKWEMYEDYSVCLWYSIIRQMLPLACSISRFSTLVNHTLYSAFMTLNN